MNSFTDTQSICPVCNRPVPASYEEKDGAVYFIKKCPEHGVFSALASRDIGTFQRWMDFPVINIPPKEVITKGVDGECPLHCGTCEHHLQTACCVLIDVTERCNQHCPFCFASAGDVKTQDPSLNTIEAWYDKLLALGETRPFNIQLSGGEPTVREDLPEIIKMGREKGFDFIQLNTNGKRIAQEERYAQKLKDAGVSVVFLQFDGLNDRVYEALRGEALLEIKKKAIENCKQARIPVTLVPTLVKNVNMDQIGEMMRFMLGNLDVVKGIHFQPASFFGRHPEEGVHDGNIQGDFENRVTMFETMEEIEKQTTGLFDMGDMLPITTGHPLCCFCGNYLREKDGSITSLMSDGQKSDGVDCCCSEPDPEEIIRKDRDFVLNKWEVGEAEQSCCCGGSQDNGSNSDNQDKHNKEPDEEPYGFDEVIAYLRRNMFTVSGMAFMDKMNLDAERLKRCRVQVFTKDERLIPFCGYNSIYREETWES